MADENLAGLINARTEKVNKLKEYHKQAKTEIAKCQKFREKLSILTIVGGGVGDIYLEQACENLALTQNNLVNELRAHIESPGPEFENRYNHAVNGIKSAYENAVEAQNQYLQRLGYGIAKIRYDITHQLSSGLKAPKAMQRIEEAKAALEKHDYAKAATAAMLAEAELEKTELQYDMTLKRIKDVEENLEVIDKYGLSAAESRLVLLNSKKMLNEGDYVKSLELVVMASDIISKEIEELGQQRDKTREIVAKFTDLKIKVSPSALALIEKAKEYHEKGDYVEMGKYIDRAESELEKVGLQHDMAIKALTTAEEKLRGAEKEGLNIPEAVNVLTEAGNLIKEGDYVKTLELAVKSGDIIHEARDKREEERKED